MAQAIQHRLSRRATLVLALLVIPAARTPAFAQQDDLWTVRGVTVDIAGTDAVTARERALAQGTRQAWETLLPRVAPAERQAALKALTTAELEALSDGIEIEDERVAPTRYAATLTVVFSADRVRTLLADANVGGAGPGTPGAPAGKVLALARYRGLADWTEMQRRLAQSPAVARLDIRTIGLNEAELTLTLTQDEVGAASTLALAGIRTEMAPGGPFRLSLVPAR